ncbi:GntR family transcriptional regulator [Roseobacteraceae bacterium S113]
MAREKQTDAVIREIMGQIEAGTLLPGMAIVEKALMAACDVSRTPVREALIQLEADGLVVRHARKGVQLFRPTTEEFLAILEVHAGLEAQAAELAARRISPQQAGRLRETAAACRAFADDGTRDPMGYYALNMAFHEIIAEAACNPFLIEMIKLNARKLMAHYRLRYLTPGAVETSAREHEAITAHILDQDATGARLAMSGHFNYPRETVMHMIASVK